MSYVSDHALYGLGAVDDTAQALLTRFGIGWNNAVRAVYYVQMNVGTTDFGSDAVKVLVQATQAGLTKIGRYKGPVDGVMGPQTVASLESLFGKRWRYMTWYNVLNQILNRAQGVKSRQKVASVLSGLGGADAATYKQLQTLLRVTADGKLGPQTLGALQGVLRGYPNDLPMPSSTADITANIDSYVSFMQSVSGSVAAPKPAPSVSRPAPTAPPPAPSGGFLSGGMSGLFSNPLVIAGGVFAVLLFTVGRKKKAAA